ncbi:MAG TPA: cell division protein FtsH, partial [Thermotogota bacterium]|nr:cell division protein FtsH [Thermotogota bacterium]
SAMLGGRAAEEIVFEEITSGASNDIERATELARTMVCQLGMSSALGPISWGKEEQEVFLGRDISRMKNFSDETAKVIDEEVKKIIEKCYNRAKEMIRKYKGLLDRLAEILLEKEVIDGEFLREMLNSEMAKENHKQSEMPIEPKLIKELG